eukprot:190747-Pleurochrysis_carterae.AAC.3
MLLCCDAQCDDWNLPFSLLPIPQLCRGGDGHRSRDARCAEELFFFLKLAWSMGEESPGAAPLSRLLCASRSTCCFAFCSKRFL